MGNTVEREKDGTIVSLFRKWHTLRTNPNGVDLNTFTVMLLTHLAFEYLHNGKRHLVVNLEEVRSVCSFADDMCGYVSENGLGHWLIYNPNKAVKKTEALRPQDLLRSNATGLLSIGVPSNMAGYTLEMEQHGEVSLEDKKKAVKRIKTATNDSNVEKALEAMEQREEDYKTFADGNGTLDTYSKLYKGLRAYKDKVSRGTKLTRAEFHDLLGMVRSVEYNYLYTKSTGRKSQKELPYATEILGKLTPAESFYIPIYFVHEFVQNSKKNIQPTIYHLSFNIDDVITECRGTTKKKSVKGFGRTGVTKNKSFDNDSL